jgi:hypothetical protein
VVVVAISISPLIPDYSKWSQPLRYWKGGYQSLL